MKLSSNFIRFHNELGLKNAIDIFSKAGFEAIDFNADLKEYCTDAHDENFYKSIREYAGERGIVFEQTHAPFGSAFTDEDKTKERFNEIVTSMKHSSYLGADMIVIHPCNHIKDNNAFMKEYNFNFYKSLISYAEAYEIKIAIENIPHSITQTAEGLLDLINELDNEVFTICYDTGHANICGQNPARMIEKIGNRAECTHIHDNDGISDLHTLPYYGNIDWEEVMKAFAQVDYKGNLNYEAGLFVDKVPCELRADGAVYMAKIGKQLIERFKHYKNSI